MKEYIFAACDINGIKTKTIETKTALQVCWFDSLDRVKFWIESFLSSDKSLSDDVKDQMFKDTVKDIKANGNASLRISDLYVLKITELSKIKKNNR